MAKATNSVKDFVKERYEELAEAQGAFEGEKLQVNVRLPKLSVFQLQVIADRLHMSRPAAAAALLGAAIQDGIEEVGGLDFDDQAVRAQYEAVMGEAAK